MSTKPSNITTLGSAPGRLFELGCAPLRWLRSLHTRLLAADGPRMEHDLLLDGIAAEHREVEATATESEQLATIETTLSAELQGFLRDPRSPGVIDASESRQLARDMLRLNQQTAEHTHHLRDLAS